MVFLVSYECWQDSFVGTDGNGKAVLQTFGITPAPGTLAHHGASRSEMIGASRFDPVRNSAP